MASGSGDDVTEYEDQHHEAAAPEDAPTEPAVASALAELETLSGRDLAEHPEVFDRIHRELDSALRAIDDA
jgi:hypothetical protein